jgi:hypothetical protein
VCELETRWRVEDIFILQACAIHYHNVSKREKVNSSSQGDSCWLCKTLEWCALSFFEGLRASQGTKTTVELFQA